MKEFMTYLTLTAVMQLQQEEGNIYNSRLI